ncbi:MAG: type II toxin-antitoxin system VapC family toxin [Candidatus Hodarchaeales archaeon]|jgi:predicted nucleic acid-binding protein
MEKILIDINVYAINFVEDHPGFPFIEPFFSIKNIGKYELKVLDIVPYRAYWILTKKWKIDKSVAKGVIENFIQSFSPIEYFGLNRENVLLSFDYATVLEHDIYDCYYLSGAVAKKCTTILTTDSDFKNLCNRLKKNYSYTLDYLNPVPETILEQFSAYKM